MKQTIKTSRTAGYLEKIFRALNAHYFDGAIEEPVITIQSTPRAYGHVTVAKAWQRADGGARHELNIGAGTLDRPIENVTATVLHEMVHLYNIQTGVQDTSRGGTYHNKRFREAAEARDLHISYDKRCANKMEDAAKRTPGVKDATVNFMMLKMNVEFEEGQEPKAELSRLPEGPPAPASWPVPNAGRASGPRKR